MLIDLKCDLAAETHGAVTVLRIVTAILDQRNGLCRATWYLFDDLMSQPVASAFDAQVEKITVFAVDLTAGQRSEANLVLESTLTGWSPCTCTALYVFLIGDDRWFTARWLQGRRKASRAERFEVRNGYSMMRLPRCEANPPRQHAL